ncbi:tryptophanyl-tRNA synthetase [Cavenderia fasciculata]|uniref:tryptophan--tRNA ligase n=1 Tax=Cavenderia fasciculata TaxID=261658 RepID=F4QC58_CACFS|nr:tryptophanyl-tRNA synthetase [Cavenderia fasciculata]EGG13545.1 tryptophanyl-tRNA synthetase [Cavenderia fasciculata]|eukprot:XP_004350249.1 tryptophanyl-tRNA synthetase [Cavenderia fasciculata]
MLNRITASTFKNAKNVMIIKGGMRSYSTGTKEDDSSLIISMEQLKKHHDFVNKPTRIFSGMQPTNGGLHIGNYSGAMLNWIELQNSIARNEAKIAKDGGGAGEDSSSSLLFSIVDLHSLTNKAVQPASLRKNTVDVAIEYVACGIDPDKVVLFNQSQVPAHCELSWILSCHTALGRLENMIQFKEKSKKNTDSAVQSTYGLLAYPILMAADILLYRATHVPVGEDQTQHVELTRKIAHAFNAHYKTDYFPLPQIVSTSESKRIMSLQNAASKMSKSDVSENSRINLTDSNETIAKKISKAATDSTIGITYDTVTRPNIANLLAIASAMMPSTQPLSPADIASQFTNAKHSEFKSFLTQTITNHLAPIREKIEYHQANPKYIKEILQKGSHRARSIANRNLTDIKNIIGLYE